MCITLHANGLAHNDDRPSTGEDPDVFLTSIRGDKEIAKSI